jgi:hypothetical protein
MSHTVSGNSLRVCWTLALGLTASALFATSASAEPSSTPDPSSPAGGFAAVRDRWYLDPPAPLVEPETSVGARDSWYLDYTPLYPPARSHREQEES